MDTARHIKRGWHTANHRFAHRHTSRKLEEPSIRDARCDSYLGEDFVDFQLLPLRLDFSFAAAAAESESLESERTRRAIFFRWELRFSRTDSGIPSAVVVVFPPPMTILMRRRGFVMRGRRGFVVIVVTAVIKTTA